MLGLLSLLAQSDFLPGDGPGAGGGFRVDPTVFIVIFGLGFMIGIGGHIYKSKTAVAIGITMIMLATVLAPLFLAATR